MMKIHLHEEQFDNWMHSACYKLDDSPETTRIVCEGLFDRIPDHAKCRLCSQYFYPNGSRDDMDGWTIHGPQDFVHIDEPELLEAFKAFFKRRGGKAFK